MSNQDTAAAVVPQLGGLAGAALALANKKSSRASKALGWLMLGQSAYQTGKGLWNRQRSERLYTVAVPADDDCYPELHDWVLKRLEPPDRRALLARTSSSSSAVLSNPIPEGGTEPQATLRLFYDGSQTQEVIVEGHKIDVGLTTPGGSSAGREIEDLARWFQKERLVFTCKGEHARDALLRVLEELVAGMRTVTSPRVFIAQRWGGWTRCQDTPARRLETVVLKTGQKEALLGSINNFLSSEAAYVNLGIPYHRAYLLEGPAGTGKTSIARALAAHIGMDLRYIPLSIVPNDSSLLELLGSVGSRSMLLLEDIDIAHAARDRDDSEPGVTLSGLLNGLDGVVTPHGLIVIMTTNNMSVLDDALIRPGRVDEIIHLGHLDDDQLARLGAAVGVSTSSVPPLFGPVAPAAVVEAVKRNLSDPAAAAAAIADLVHGSNGRTGMTMKVPEDTNGRQ